ncbi:isopentenyl-diphosphate Delta-isomerase 1 [Cylas formicarius]|uniref:isopentenyl-diphosphate Delta-isomerase 1 n=1 Tax=Cylas formicarius TaxID=197179 RepID=UPI00295898F3|nr:isopentenyl-diphosphate Delta-isomerase 1 [Cylas formicarius]
MISTIRTATQRVVARVFSNVAATQNKMDPQQEAMLKEKCFLVDQNDKVIGQASKRDCHLVHDDGDILLHRAFSVFLFNKKGDLLLQKRASEKITYPDCYTNSCCSHPIVNYVGEEDENDALGIRKAAQRRLNYELGIPIDNIPIENINYITRVYYKDEGNGKYGEHEIDYVLFLKQDVKVKPNPNEVSEISFIPRAEFDDFLPTLTGRLTPWFQLILKHRLKYWWENLDNLDEIRDHKKILHLKP